MEGKTKKITKTEVTEDDNGTTKNDVTTVIETKTETEKSDKKN